MKQELREKYLYIRKNISNKEEKDKLIYDQVINNKKLLSADLILIYVSRSDEIDTIKIIEHLLKIKKIAVPKIEDNIMNFYYINNINELSPGYFNILEPTTNKKVTNFNNCVSITPGICFSKDNYRIGYGKGFYDKFYQKNKVYKIGLCYKECLIKKIPNDKYDIKVDEIISA